VRPPEPLERAGHIGERSGASRRHRDVAAARVDPQLPEQVGGADEDRVTTAVYAA
jgi:hypothetical protein